VGRLQECNLTNWAKPSSQSQTLLSRIVLLPPVLHDEVFINSNTCMFPLQFYCIKQQSYDPEFQIPKSHDFLLAAQAKLGVNHPN
jgi:hypothetical protein